jgi:hypothetical protein
MPRRILFRFFSLRRCAVAWVERVEKFFCAREWSKPLFEHRTALLIAFVLFVIPFFWFRYGEGDYGGDSSRLYYYDPFNWMKYVAFHQINVGGYSYDNPNFFMIPFLLFLTAIKVVLLQNSVLLLPFFNGMLLSGAFVSVYLSIRELLDSEKQQWWARAAAVSGAFFFVFSPLITYGWIKYLYGFHQIAVYPWFALFWLRYIKRREPLYLVAALLLSFVFAVNFSLPTTPVFFSFFPITFLFLFFYALILGRTRGFVITLFCFVPVFLLLHAFQYLGQVIMVLNPGSSIYTNLFTEAGQLGRGLGYFDSVSPMVQLLYNIAGFPQISLYIKTNVSKDFLTTVSTYGGSVLWLFFIFPITLFLGLFLAPKSNRQERLTFLALLVCFLIATFFMTANLFESIGPTVYRWLFSVPGFSMFRSFYGVFAVVFAYFYALTFGVALSMLLRRMDARRAIFGTVVLSLLLGYSAIPLLSGKLANLTIPDTEGKVKMSSRFSQQFEELLRYLRRDTLDAKIVTFPLVQFDYQIVDGEHGGAYVGPSPMSLLAGQHTFNGLSSFDYGYGGGALFNQDFILDRMKKKDYRSVNRFFALLNIGSIFYNSNEYVYRKYFKGWPFARPIWFIFPRLDDFRVFIDQLGYTKVYSAGSYALYRNPNAFLPHLYIPRSVFKINRSEEMKEMILMKDDYDLRSVFFLFGGSRDELIDRIPLSITSPPTLTVKKISTTLYRLSLRGIQSSVPVVFNEPYHPYWRFNLLLKDEVIPERSFWRLQRLPALPDEYHLGANEYANAWWIDLDMLQKRFPGILRQNERGSYDLDAVLEFVPQRYFYQGSIISLTTLIGLLSYTLVRFRRRLRRKEDEKTTVSYAP